VFILTMSVLDPKRKFLVAAAVPNAMTGSSTEATESVGNVTLNKMFVSLI
jgi:hypothetical protein